MPSSQVMLKTAVLVIDAQPEWYGPNTDTFKYFPDFEKRLTSQLQHFRSNGTPIIHIRAKYPTSPAAESEWTKWYKEFRILNPGKPLGLSGNPLPCAKELEGEPVFVKPTFDAFLGTGLNEYLQKEGFGDLILMGLITSVCVQMTANEAFMRGYRVSVVSDACADRSKDRHEAAKLLYGGYVWHELELVNPPESPGTCSMV